MCVNTHIVSIKISKTCENKDITGLSDFAILSILGRWVKDSSLKNSSKSGTWDSEYQINKSKISYNYA